MIEKSSDRISNETYLDKLRLLNYYKEPIVVDLLERIIKYKDISLADFCSKYIKDCRITQPKVQCEIVQYIADNNLTNSDEAMLACEDVLDSMESVDDMLAVIKEGIDLRDIIDFNKAYVDGISGADIQMALADYMVKTGSEVHGLRFETNEEGNIDMYYLDSLIPGKIELVVSVNLIDEAVVLSDTDLSDYYHYYLGDTNGLGSRYSDDFEEDDYDDYTDYDNYDGYNDYYGSD